MLRDEAGPIAVFKPVQQAAFEAERERWRAAGLSEAPKETAGAAASEEDHSGFAGAVVVSQVSGGLWSELVKLADAVTAGQPLLVVESMKMVTAVTAPRDGVVEALLLLRAGQPG